MKKFKKAILLALCCIMSISVSAQFVPNNEIWYTSSDNQKVIPNRSDVFGVKIRQNTFKDGKGIIRFSGDVTVIGFEAFRECSNLTGITLPGTVTRIADCAFSNCAQLAEVEIPYSVKAIGGAAFSHCASLRKVVLPNTVTSIGNVAFYYCTELTDVVLPPSLERIGDAFKGCTALSKVCVSWKTPLDIKDYVFPKNQLGIIPATLYVPDGTKAVYQGSSVWCDFQNVREYGEADSEELIPVMGKEGYYDMMGNAVGKDYDKLRIIRKGKRSKSVLK